MTAPRGMRGWILAVLAAVAVAAVAYAVQPPSQDSPDHSSDSDAAAGTSAVLLFARAMGHPTGQLGTTFTAPAGGGLMFVFTPMTSFTSAEAQSTLSWVRSGGVLVYAAEQGDPELDRSLGVVRSNTFVFLDGEVANPTVDGVTSVAGGTTAQALDPATGQVPFLRAPAGLVTGYIERLGSGYAVVMSDPLVLCNGYLGRKDNGRLLADLLGLASPGSAVVFDEYHHNLKASDFGLATWLLTPWGAALLWLIVAVFAGLVLRGRRFGPRVGRPQAASPSDVEWSVAVGRLLRRASGRELTLGILSAAAEREVASRTGLPVQPRERFWNALWVRSPETAADLAEAETLIAGDAATEHGALEAAQRLHRIAYPLPERRAGSATR